MGLSFFFCRFHRVFKLSNSTFERYAQEFLCLYGKLHRQLIEHILGIAIDDQANCLLGRNASLIAIEELVFRNLRGSRLMLKYGRIVMGIHIWEGMRTTIATQE